MTWLLRSIRGGLAGFVATSAMTAYMIGLERAGVMHGQPPRMIIDRFAPGLQDQEADLLAAVAHAAYGAMAGVVFAQLAAGRPDARLLGVSFGLLVWAGGYEVWVPALGVLPQAHHDRPARVGTMVTAHLLYGYLLGQQLR